MAGFVCPKCGFTQESSDECMRCGIIFARYRSSTLKPADAVGLDPSPAAGRPGVLRRIYKVLSWASLAFLLLALVLILRPSAPPQVTVNPEAARRAEAKVREFSASGGRQESLIMDQTELNGWIRTNLALDREHAAVPPVSIDGSSITVNGRPLGQQAGSPDTVRQVQGSVRDVRMELRGDSIRAYVLFDLFSKDMSLELEGHIAVRDGHLRLEPTAGRLGSLPLTAGMLRSAAERLFDAPENRDKFLLPPEIRDVRVQDGRLIVSSRQ